MGVTAFKSVPNCAAVCSFLGRTIAKAKKTPRYIVCDRGEQFDCKGFRKWCKRKGIKRPRYGAIGKHGSIAVVERVILTIKCLLSCLPFVPYRREAFLRELTQITEWYNRIRPHSWLGGKTPNEVYYGRFPANRRPRFEPRSRWPRGSPCAKPWALVRGSPGAKLTLEVSFPCRPQTPAHRHAEARWLSSAIPCSTGSRYPCALQSRTHATSDQLVKELLLPSAGSSAKSSTLSLLFRSGHNHPVGFESSSHRL